MKTLLVLCIVLKATLSWANQPIDYYHEGGGEEPAPVYGQVAIPPAFNPTSLDEETLDSYFLHLVEQRGAAFPELASQSSMPVGTLAYASTSSEIATSSNQNSGGGQVAIPQAFNPTTLDAQTLDAYFLDLATQNGSAFAQLAPSSSVPVTISAEAYASMAGTSEPASGANTASEIIVGYVRCNIRAHNPHKSRDSGTVKAKASGSCSFTPSGQGIPPPPQVMFWTLRMALLLDGRGTMGIARYSQRGWNPEWHEDRPRGRGTQVDSNKCINGNNHNFVLVLLQVPAPYTAPAIVGAAYRNARVTECN